MASTEEMTAQIENERRAVDVDHLDLSVREIAAMVARGELVMSPEYQRFFRWKVEDESRLVESLILGLPVPPIFVASNPDGKWEIVDGLQRVSTLVHFVAGSPDHEAVATDRLALVAKSERLKLAGLSKLSTLNDLTYDELPGPVRLRFARAFLRVTALSDKSDETVRFELFERLNTGGIRLTHQEVRFCVFRGEFAKFLREMAGRDAFKALLKLQEARDNDGTREELVLKFFAYLRARKTFDGAVTDFLNAYMKAASGSFDRAADEALFTRVVDELNTIMAGQPVVRSNYANTPINQFEAVMVAAGELLAEPGASLRPPTTGWLDDQELVSSSTKGTNTPAALRRRIERAKQLLSPTAHY